MDIIVTVDTSNFYGIKFNFLTLNLSNKKIITILNKYFDQLSLYGSR